MKKTFNIDKDWQFRISKNDSKEQLIPNMKLDEWIQAVVPGTVHTDLLTAGLIDEPFKDDNELSLDWIAKSDWIYKTTFDYPDDFSTESPVNLVFDGLDTKATIWLNDKEVGTTENMFLQYKFDVTEKMQHKNNELKILFESPINYAKNIEAKYGKLPSSINTERVYIRKAQYSFGWDWGPTFPTMGVWRPAYLLQEDQASLRSVKFDTLQIEDNVAKVAVRLLFQLQADQHFKADVVLSNSNQKFTYELMVSDNKEYELEFSIKNPKLWQPNGIGAQNLYNLEITLLNDKNNTVDSVNKKVGIRTIELELEKNGEPDFQIVVNKNPLFIKGVNWIPADMFLPRVSPDKYKMLLQMVKDVNINLVRIWGGGIYEDDFFYELCDELGLLVWQDFMFACGAYPEHDDFISNVKEELIWNIERLQAHPSLAIWCGNNENEWIWFNEQTTPFQEMSGYNIYHQVIPDILKELDPRRPYWQTTPFGFNDDPNSQQSGNTHQWDIWSKWIDYTDVNKDASLFVAEFGFQSPANIDTLEKFISPEHRHIESHIFEFHNKQVEGMIRLLHFLMAHLPVVKEWRDFIYLTQLNQSLALKTCIEHWRVNDNTNGSIIWQFNDVWSGSSWSLVDAESKPKMTYYFVKNIFKHQIISIRKSDSSLETTVLNCSQNNFSGSLKINFYETSTGELFNKKEQTIKIDSDTGKFLSKISLESIYGVSKKWIAIATLYDESEQIINRDYFTEDRWNLIKLPVPKIEIKTIKENGSYYLSLSTNKPAFFIDLYYPNFNFSDRGFILLPGEDKKLMITNGKVDPPKLEDIIIFSLNNFLQNDAIRETIKTKIIK
ncbi:MAG: glycoside hydrolase family 2 protein [Chlorobi bacterium]|nr:glycoside hydrolase family 2 protein [Chlorobiota bacterium]